jgi:hypothetical protein
MHIQTSGRPARIAKNPNTSIPKDSRLPPYIYKGTRCERLP